MTDALFLAISRWLDPQPRGASGGNICDRDKVGSPGLRTEDSEEVDLAAVIPSGEFLVSMVSVGTRRGEFDGTIPQPSRLALDAGEANAVVDDEVGSSVLSKGQKEAVPAARERAHDREYRSIAYDFGVFHPR